MTDPRVTVLMSVYNGERFLKPAVDSILKQTFREFVFLILNDGSRDKTAEILEGYDDPRLRVVENRENTGLAKSLNRGLEVAETEYIARMDADDISHPDRLEKQIRYLDENPEVGLLGTRYVRIDEDGRERGEIYVPIGRDNIKRNLLVRNSFCHGSVVFRKSVIERAGFYNEDITVAQDYDLWLRVADLCPVENYPEVLHKWRVNEQTGISVTRFSEQEQMALAIREGHIRGKIEKGSEEFPSLMQLALAHPLDQLIAQIAMEEFEKSGGAAQDFRIHCMKLGYLHKFPKHPYLNQVARYYSDMGKESLAFMCLVESLKLCPEQPEILELSERFRRSIEPVIPERLPDDRCTVSVIMPTYNRTSEIRESILSVLNQTFKDLELIVVNDGGTDEVGNIINNFNSSSIKYYKIRMNKGLSGALNEGLIRANGRYIAYLDDDDIYHPNHIEKLVDFIEKNPEFDCIYSHAWWCYGESVDGTFVEHYRNLNYRPEKFDRAALGDSNYPSQKELFNESGAFQRRPGEAHGLGSLDETIEALQFPSARHCDG
jgi:glycosyltransferase involved in cell wall biosynthesis